MSTKTYLSVLICNISGPQRSNILFDVLVLITDIIILSFNASNVVKMNRNDTNSLR